MNPVFTPLVEKFKQRPFIRRGRRVPYVAFGYMSKNHNKDGSIEEVPFMHVLDCSGSIGQAGMITHYVKNKGFEILDYWFPNVAEEKIRKGAIGERSLQMKFDNDEGFGALEREIAFLQGRGEKRIQSLEEENKVLEAKVEKYRKELEEAKGAKKGKE